MDRNLLATSSSASDFCFCLLEDFLRRVELVPLLVTEEQYRSLRALNNFRMFVVKVAANAWAIIVCGRGAPWAITKAFPTERAAVDHAAIEAGGLHRVSIVPGGIGDARR